MVNIRNFTDIPNALDSAANGTFLYKTASGVEFQTLEYTDITDYPSTDLDSAGVLSIIDSNYVSQKLNVGSNAFNVLNYADSGVSSNVTKDSGGSTVKIGNYSKGIGNTYLDSSSIVTIGDHSFSLSNGLITFSGGNASSFIGAISITYLIVGGGGGGGSGHAGGGGGGGGGGIISGSAELEAGTYSITVGAGGAGAVAADPDYEDAGYSGGSSTFNSLTAGGGGGGAGFSDLGTYGAPSNGSATNGSGGGGMWATYTTGGTGDGTGNAGGDGAQFGGYADRSAGGGGGSGGAGSDAYQSGGDEIGGDGGAGTLSSITGSSVSYAAGGGGGARGSATTSSGGTGGGDGGSSTTSATSATTAGSGGGGGGHYDMDGGNGAAGVVIISSSTAASSTTGTVSTSTVGSNYVYQFTSDGSITF